MCVSCREPLALAQSPQAIAERGYISELVQQGLTKKQIEQALVGQYGLAVLGRPPAHGFNLTVYILPPALVLAGVALLAVYLPRWRRRARARRGHAPPPRSRTRRRRCAPARRGPRPLRLTQPAARYIESGALTPSSPSDSAIVRWAASDRAIRSDWTDSGVTPTTLQSR